TRVPSRGKSRRHPVVCPPRRDNRQANRADRATKPFLGRACFGIIHLRACRSLLPPGCWTFSCPQPAAFDRAGRKGAGPDQPAPIASDQLLIISRVELWFTPTVADAPETGTPKIDPCTLAVLLSDFWCVRVVTGPSVLTLSRARIWVRCRPFSWNTR